MPEALMNVRSCWQANLPLPQELLDAAAPEVRELCQLEADARLFLERQLMAMRALLGDDAIAEIEPLISSANLDLCAGCELARLGYLKQAYALWRAWFEQIIFAFYFLESPIQRTAWKVEEAVSDGKKPLHHLMLHKFLEPDHAFALVYKERIENLLAAMKKSPVKVLKEAEHVFTDLSQGVHGTFRPVSPTGPQEVAAALKLHALGKLRKCLDLLVIFGTAQAVGLSDLTEDFWTTAAPATADTGDGENRSSVSALIGLVSNSIARIGVRK